jgi:(p)ppGpp synthase/HD superfamily hydrolase
MAGVLHDVIEDRKYFYSTKEVLQFGRQVLKYVLGVSKKRGWNPLSDFYSMNLFGISFIIKSYCIQIGLSR